MKKFSLLFLISILIIMLQSAIFSNIPILGVSLDIVFIYIVCFALVRNNVDSVIIALFTGIIRDSFFPGLFGLNTLIYIVIAYVIGLIQRRIYRDNLIIPIFFTFVATYLKDLVYIFFFYIMSYKYDIRQYALGVILLEAIYNSMAGILVYKFVLKLESMRILKHSWKF